MRGTAGAGSARAGASRGMRMANKRDSKRTVIPAESLRDKNNLDSLLEAASTAPPGGHAAFLLALCARMLSDAGLPPQTVGSFVTAHRAMGCYAGPLPELPEGEDDPAGIVYSLLLTEGEKNSAGMYWTPPETALGMLGGICLGEGERLLDPCCGTGALLRACLPAPEGSLFGVERDPVAAMICRANLLASGAGAFTILTGDFFSWQPPEGGFDAVVANPPWGAIAGQPPQGLEDFRSDTFALFLAACGTMLRQGGTLRFLMPESFLNVAAHSRIRGWLTSSLRLEELRGVGKVFSGVFTGAVLVCARKEEKRGDVLVSGFSAASSSVPADAPFCRKNELLTCSRREFDLLDKLFSPGYATLAGSVFFMGIVTGDNRSLVHGSMLPGCEPILTGRDVSPFLLREPGQYVRFDRRSFQQCAPEELYRSPLKLVYRFVSSRLVFAMDESGALFLNSANLLVPDVPGYDADAVLAMLNSEVFAFINRVLFGQIKVLKGNLTRLPFPALTGEQAGRLSEISRGLRAGRTVMEKLQEAVSGVFGLDDSEIAVIRA